MRQLLLYLLLLFFVSGLPSWSQTIQDYVRANYTKYETRVPMRDGVELFTTLYVPNDASSVSYPILLRRTPYSLRPYGSDAYTWRLMHNEAMVRDGYIFVFQDVRGKYMSQGEFINMRPHIGDKSAARQVDESTDTFDTIAWLLDHLDNDNGRVGMWGISYPGFYTSAGMIDSHPALKAASPQAPIADWFWDDMHHHGAFSLNLAFNFFSSFGQARLEPTPESAARFDHGTPDGYQFFLELGPLKNVNARYFHGKIDFWNKLTEHPNYDAFWQSRNILPHLKNVNCAVLVVGGWFDAEDLYGPLHTYAATERQNPDTDVKLVMGPWRHGGWARGNADRLADARFGFDTSVLYQKDIEKPFFDHHLKGKPAPNLAEATMFETGANRWRRFEQWPPAGPARQLFPDSDGALSFSEPTADKAYDAYVSDPAKPVPYTEEITNRWSTNYMAADQRFAARRPDVLVYRTAPLAEDLTIAGPLEASLWVSTSGTDGDFVVKLIDEYPPDAVRADDNGEPEAIGGMQLMVRSEIFRGRFRDSYEHPKPFVPDQPTLVKIPLQDVLHTFKRGHRITIQVQSSLFPFFDRNPQTYIDNIFDAEAADFKPAEVRLYRDRAHPTHIQFHVLE